jgi:hypothetical protein
MIVICTHQSPEILRRMLVSIRKFEQESHKILVVETSNSQMSKSVADEFNCLFSNTELKYEIGAYNHALDIFPNEDEYFMFQDSLEMVQHQWESHYRILSEGRKMVAMCKYTLLEDPCPLCGKKEFESLYGLEWPLQEASAVLCNCFYVPQSAAKKLKEFGINKLTANDKNDTYATERVLGAIAHYTCGFDSVATILGDYVSGENFSFLPNTGFTIYIQKYIHKRQ